MHFNFTSEVAIPPSLDITSGCAGNASFWSYGGRELRIPELHWIKAKTSETICINRPGFQRICAIIGDSIPELCWNGHALCNRDQLFDPDCMSCLYQASFFISNVRANLLGRMRILFVFTLPHKNQICDLASTRYNDVVIIILSRGLRINFSRLVWLMLWCRCGHLLVGILVARSGHAPGRALHFDRSTNESK
ncbi:hypothetical protein ANRL3_02367 [Anaerolineae bacterium]|nr:hypothetical protein ANRL3_02367 [Anaerolineae bacterium]